MSPDLFDEIPDRLKSFIKKNISSFSILEVLLLLKRDAQRLWTPEELSIEMRTNVSYATAQLAELTSLKLVEAEGTNSYRYSPQNVGSEIIDELESLYNSRRSTVINYIYSQPSDSIRDFANAFKIKKD